MKHPAVSENAKFFLTPEEQFAKAAYEILGHYGVMCEDLQQGLSYPVTDKLEISEEGEPAVRALRLRRTAVMQIAQSTYPEIHSGQSVSAGELSNDYVVLEMQHGEVPCEEIDETEPLVDEDFSWSSYVLAVLKAKEPYDLDVLDAKTGKALSFEEIFIATEALRHLGNWLYIELHENGLENDNSIAIEATYSDKVDLSATDNFEASEADLNYTCIHCGQDNGVCDHNTPKMN